jgi:Mg-chelatase subunit ChlD
MRVTGAKINPKLVNITVSVDVTTTPPTTETKKELIHNVFIIDASGSMSGSKYVNAIDGVNELLKSIKNDTDTDNNVMIVEFEGDTISTRLDLGDKIPETYRGMGTNGMTPLNQAIGQTLEYVQKKRKSNFSESDKVLVNIFTDGGENSSRGKYANNKTLSDYITELQNNGFTITFVGTKTEVAYAINSLSMDASNTLVHNNTASDIKRSFNDTVLARQMYSKSVSLGEVVTDSFYTKKISE